jgi:hypothetical protein
MAPARKMAISAVLNGSYMPAGMESDASIVPAALRKNPVR